MGNYSQVNMVKWKHRLIRSLCICTISSNLFLKSAFEYEHRLIIKKYIKILRIISAFAGPMILVFFFVLFAILLVECRQEPDYLGFLWLRPSEEAKCLQVPLFKLFPPAHEPSLLPCDCLPPPREEGHLMASSSLWSWEVIFEHHEDNVFGVSVNFLTCTPASKDTETQVTSIYMFLWSHHL